jgi:hypothetical protein
MDAMGEYAVDSQLVLVVACSCVHWLLELEGEPHWKTGWETAESVVY